MFLSMCLLLQWGKAILCQREYHRNHINYEQYLGLLSYKDEQKNDYTWQTYR